MTEQIERWSGEFGKAYTDRNPQTVEEMDQLYYADFGLTRMDLNGEFVGPLEKTIRILEVGANVGTQLRALQTMGFERLFGIEVQAYALQQAKRHANRIRFVRATAADLPWKTDSFDLVFTSGVLIHISPETVGDVLDEIYRCTSRYIWGWEYFAEQYTNVPYRGHDRLLWKADFAQLYLQRFPDLKLIKEKRVRYLKNNDEDTMFLLEKPAP